MTDTLTEEETGPQLLPFGVFLQQQRRGALHEELTQELHALLQAISDTGKAGRLTIQLNVKPAAKGARDEVVISDVVVVKKPALERPESHFWLDDDGNLARTDPRQQELPLKVVDARPQPTELKEISR